MNESCGDMCGVGACGIFEVFGGVGSEAQVRLGKMAYKRFISPHCSQAFVLESRPCVGIPIAAFFAKKTPLNPLKLSCFFSTWRAHIHSTSERRLRKRQLGRCASSCTAQLAISACRQSVRAISLCPSLSYSKEKKTTTFLLAISSKWRIVAL